MRFDLTGSRLRRHWEISNAARFRTDILVFFSAVRVLFVLKDCLLAESLADLKSPSIHLHVIIFLTQLDSKGIRAMRMSYFKLDSMDIRSLENVRTPHKRKVKNTMAIIIIIINNNKAFIYKGG